jgi:ketosteroid isomerase-like protein
MEPVKLALITALLAFSLALAGAAADASAPPQQPAGEGKSQSSPRDQTTDDDARKYEEAYNKGDAKTLAGFYSQDVDYIDQDGAEVKGRDAMQKLLADNFQQNPGVKLAITTEEVKQLTPDVKVSHGFANRDAGKWRGDDGTVHAYQGQERRSLGDFPIERKGGTTFERLRETRGS